ncbi:cleavage stimulating factor 64 [Typha angustifolia]|uniref:cleavage stimulating factor 64 n=1 Tax=Typha angustifolia TaxID=59011 RepID=UPI003C2CA252
MAASAAGSQHRCVFVGNIPYDATEEQLVQICEEVGPVVSFRLVLDRETGKPKGYGFCEYKDEETALSARRNLQGYEINGRQLRVDFAENDKNADRNREQGRGGPGMASNIGAQKQVGGPSILGDLTLHQPMGLPLAANAATYMAGTLGGPQIASNQNGLPIQPGTQNDPLTHYLARMSRQQLQEILSELKSLATQNKALARQLLQGSPQLPKALFQAQIMLGMITPQMMQMARPQQSSSLFPHPSSNIAQSLPQSEALMAMLSRPLESQVANISRQAMLPLPHVREYQQPPPTHDQVLPHGTIPSKSGVVTLPPAQSQSLGVLSVQPSLQQHPRPSEAATLAYQPQVALANTNLQRQLLSNQTRGAGPMVNPSHPPKLRKLEDGTAAREMMNSSASSIYSVSAQANSIGAVVSGSQIAIAEATQQSEKQTPELSPEMQTALLQQVLNLTPEQLSSLPVEQQEQVRQLQQMLSTRR